jgi:tetratricopeptide (TPR) repeat protein
MNTLLKRAVPIFLIICLGFVVHSTQRAMDRHKVIRFVKRQPVFLPRGEVLKWMSMGYRGLLGDWLWIRTVLYYGRRVLDHDNPYYVHMMEKGSPEEELEARKPISTGIDSLLDLTQELSHLLYRFESRGLVDYIYPMLDRVTTVDPHFIFPYIFGGVYIMLDTGEIDAAQKLLEKGYEVNPDRWEFPFYLGWIHWMYRGDTEMTTRYLSQAVALKECPRYVGNLFMGLSRNLGQTKLTKLYLEGLLESTDNPEIRERIEELLEKMLNQNEGTRSDREIRDNKPNG